MADFVLEYSRRPDQHHESGEQEWWTLRVDGASRSSGSGVGLLLQSPTGEHLEQAIRLGFSASNNEAEYEAILSGLDLALALSVSKLRIYSDSQLVVRHVQKEYEAKDSRMARYLAKVRSTLQQFTEWTIEKIKRADNGRADALAENSTCNSIEANQADDQEWTHDIAEYLRTGTLPEDPKRAHKIRAQYVLAELHEGVCGNHTGGRSLAHRAHSQGYYWPTMKKDAAAYVQKCDKCQRYAPIPHIPSIALKSVSSPWPFAQWGMDIVGPLPAAPAQKKFLLVATDYFSKWVEAEAYASIKDKDVTKFVWKNIVCRYGIPQIIIADNGPQFDSIAFRNFCSELNIRNSYSTPRYPQSNGQAEATNKTLVNALKKGWSEPKGIIPTEIGLPTIRTDAAKQKDADTELGRNLDWADEVRESASIRMADYQQRASAHYNRKVRPRNFKNGTLVLRKVFENTAEVGAGKFQANWEGPYIVSKANENGAYHLQKLDGTPLLRPWNELKGISLYNRSSSCSRRYPKINVSSTCLWYPLQVPPFPPANSRSMFLFLHIQTQLQVFLCFFSFKTSVRSRLNSSLSRVLPHPPPHEGGPQLILLDPLPQPTPPGGLHFPLAWWIDWPQPPPFSDAS
ncbi:Uncharacterized protein K02A2.6 [Vitis vinifera]|uniref:Uncharacterized protein K02A2.6 n=1 Tax=Vitis vinifera TaxID=29760 RepID=A0A438F594_VITVI|nr:Uncharacterized protein K02A2.6 [Vitis vinifera]